MKMVYEWKKGTRISVDAEKVGKELERLPKRDTATVVQKAKNPESAMHKHFVWDNKKAGDLYRIDQARYLLRSIVIVEIPEEDDQGKEEIRYRAFETVHDDEEDVAHKAMVYVPTREAMSQPEQREQIMGRLVSTIREAEDTVELYQRLVPKERDPLKVTRRKLKEAREAVPA
jgi:hypothetical protein